MDERSLWEDRTSRQWLPVAVEDMLRAAAPRRTVLLGSVACGDEGPNSDLDLLVVFDRIDPADRTRLISSIRRTISARAPIDVFVTDLIEYQRRKDVIGSMTYRPTREGEVVYERVLLIRMGGGLSEGLRRARAALHQSTSVIGGMLSSMGDYVTINKAMWDERTPAHAASAGYPFDRLVDDPQCLSASVPQYLSAVVRLTVPGWAT